MNLNFFWFLSKNRFSKIWAAKFWVWFICGCLRYFITVVITPRHKFSNIQYMGRVMRKGPGRHDMWFRVICSWNHLSAKNGISSIGFSLKERFLWFQLLFLDFYHFHHVIWRIMWAKKLKTKNGQNMSSGPFSHDAVLMVFGFPKTTSHKLLRSKTLLLGREIVLPTVRSIQCARCISHYPADKSKQKQVIHCKVVFPLDILWTKKELEPYFMVEIHARARCIHSSDIILIMLFAKILLLSLENVTFLFFH